MPTTGNKTNEQLATFPHLEWDVGIEANLPAMFFSPREDPAFAVSAAHEQLNILTVHSLRARGILECIRILEVYAMFM